MCETRRDERKPTRGIQQSFLCSPAGGIGSKPHLVPERAVGLSMTHTTCTCYTRSGCIYRLVISLVSGHDLSMTGNVQESINQGLTT